MLRALAGRFLRLTPIASVFVLQQKSRRDATCAPTEPLVYLKLRDGADPDADEGGHGPSSPAVKFADKEQANFMATLLTSERLGHWNEIVRTVKLMDIRELFRTLRLSKRHENTKADLASALQYIHTEYMRVSSKPWPVGLWPSGPPQMANEFGSVVYHCQEEYTAVGDRYRKDLDKFARANERRRGEEAEDSDDERDTPHWRKADRKMLKDEKINQQADAMIKVRPPRVPFASLPRVSH